ncbi:MAG TPA: hypothetical protein VGR66_13125 [Candidatus Eisenbacteria bacterium]|jgi:hypothetical protein|nr:hypothetical protein [Candidatus Eisenbacteria bacterium]
MNGTRWTTIGSVLVALALAWAPRPAFACAALAATVHPARAVVHSTPVHALPATLAIASHRAAHHHHRHLAHHANLTRNLSASLPASLPVRPALPHSGRAAAAHHAPTTLARQGKGSSRAASFLAERFAWRADRLSYSLGLEEHGIPKNRSFDVKAGRGPPRAGPYGDNPSAVHAAPAWILESPTHIADSLTPPRGRFLFGARSAAAFAFREPKSGAATWGERCRLTRSRFAAAPTNAAQEARRFA